jgi:hypothetical protein
VVWLAKRWDAVKNLVSKTPCDPQCDDFVFMENVGPFGFSSTIIIWTMLLHFHFCPFMEKQDPGVDPPNFVG